MKNLLFAIFMVFSTAFGQKMPVSYDFGEKFNDRHKYSNLVTISEDGDGGYLLVRSYFQGLILKPRGYIIERYDADLNLVSEYNYKFNGMQFVDGFFHNGILNLLFFNYDFEMEQYEYWVHQSSVLNYDFKPKRLMAIKSQVVQGAFGKNYYNRNFKKGFSTILLFDKEKNGFLISTHHKRGKLNKHTLHLFDTNLNKRWEHDFSNEVEDKNYAFEQLALSENLDYAYIVGKAYFKKKRFEATERKFQYEVIKVSQNEAKTQQFLEPGKYPEALYPLFKNEKLVCVGFYANRKDNRYNGLTYYELNPASLSVEQEKYHPFTPEFMSDKFGREDDKEIKNLVFKGVELTSNGEIIFNAEEYFVTESMQRTGAGQRIKVERFHHNDIVSAKLNAAGDMEWVRNINKLEVTQGDGAYASYSSFFNNGKTYFFICTASENPQLLGNERIVFKQGLGRNRNVFTISLDENGKLDYEKIIDAKDARLPLMVSKPFVNKNEGQLLFYAKQGNKKQLVEVEFED
ncbi:hypothetical protein [Croceivirga thetidis]|uniref:Uncharacterized protein n=1 Tax=Croceivirga thetidis TaxID=2721623 RepID=A0ABX1GPS7_9FLAO|nr:hypothetical protein [Croceivirga thetidis]NKI31041.1 hypothetical protein [Croceivirga thetidis]